MDILPPEEIKKLEEKLTQEVLPPELSEKAKTMVDRLGRIAKLGGNYAAEFDATSRYLDWICSLPWDQTSKDTLELDAAKTILQKNHYGLDAVKEKILEYLAVLKITTETGKFNRAPILLLVGLVGTGKTTLAYSVAEAMGRKFERIPFGGIGDALYLRGQSRSYPDAEPGAVIKALRRAGTANPVILLDEVDRVAEAARTTIMGVLVELLDPEQNNRYVDHYLDYPVDLSKVLFIATANNTTNISTAVLDRLEPIQMPSYSDEEKIKIGRDYVLPRVLAESGLTQESLKIADELWPKIVRPLGFDAGIRTLERSINNMVRKAAKEMLDTSSKQITVDEKNLAAYLAS